MAANTCCRICRSAGADGKWCGWIVHTACYERIKSAEANLKLFITSLFKDTKNKPRHYYTAHTHAVGAVEDRCNGASISDYVDSHGLDALTALFDTAGMAAVDTYFIRCDYAIH